MTDRVSLSVLGTVVSVPHTLADLCADLPRTTRTAVAAVDSFGEADGLAELTRLAVENSPLLCVHACVVAGPHGLLAVPGRSGLGKTTLAAALVKAGFDYVSDEALALDRVTRLVQPFARPLGISADVWQLLGLNWAAPAAGTEKLVPPTAFGPVAATGGRVHDVVLAERVPGRPSLTRGFSGDAVRELLTRSFNHYREAEASFRALVGVVREARVWRVRYANAPELAALLSDRLEISARARIASR